MSAKTNEKGDMVALDGRSAGSCFEATLLYTGDGCAMKGLVLKLLPDAEDVSLDNDSTLFACTNVEGCCHSWDE